MPYMGNTPSTSFATVTKDAFSGDGSETEFTLSKVATTNSVSVFVENVRQEPTSAYAVSGTTLTFTAAPVSSGGNNIYVLHMLPTSTATHPAAQNLTAVDGTFTGDLTVDTDTLKVDASEDTVCINTTATNFDAGADDLIVGSGSGDSGITIYTGSSVGDKGSIFFADSTTGSSAEKKGQISYEQNNEIMTFYTNDTLAMKIDLNGNVTKPLQPLWSAIRASTRMHTATGYTMTNDQIIEFSNYENVGSHVSSNIFTAPVAGRYLCNVWGMSYSATSAWVAIYTYLNSTQKIICYNDIHTAWQTFGSSIVLGVSANDTIKFHVQASHADAKWHENSYGGCLVTLLT